MTGWGLAGWGLTPGVYPPPPAPPPADDLVAAVVAQLRAWNGGAIPAAVGEAGGVKKIWVDVALGSISPPYIVITEPVENLSEESSSDDGVIHYVGPGELLLTVYADLKTVARSLRTQIAAALNDAPLVFAGGELLHFRLKLPMSQPQSGVTPDSPQGYAASARFGYFVDRTF